jgi:hypothetical protein
MKGFLKAAGNCINGELPRLPCDVTRMVFRTVDVMSTVIIFFIPGTISSRIGSSDLTSENRKYNPVIGETDPLKQTYDTYHARGPEKLSLLYCGAGLYL